VAALVVLVAAAPLLLIGHTLPRPERYARAWWRTTLALLVAPVAHRSCWPPAFRVLLTSDGVLGLPIERGFIDILVVGTLLYFLFKVPFWMLHATFPSPPLHLPQQPEHNRPRRPVLLPDQQLALEARP
jgi:hypothetical protein